MPAPASPSERFEAAFELHHRAVLAYALRRCRTAADAEDVAAAAFAVAWRRVQDLPEPDVALPWLLGIARRVAADLHRSHRRLAGLFDRLRAQPRPPVGPVPESPVTEALARLPPGDRELLRLLAWEGLSQAEAAMVLGISANAVAIRLHRARKRFAAALAKGSGSIRPPLMHGGSTSREDTR